MPASSEKQRRFMLADADRARRGVKTRTGMTIGQLMEYGKPAPKRKTKKKR